MSFPFQQALGNGSPSTMVVKSSPGRMISPPKSRFHLVHASATFRLDGRSAGLQ